MINWKGKDLITNGDMLRAMDALSGKAEALDFMKEIRVVGPHAESNVGYLCGYFAPEKCKQLMDWLEVAHPIFGTTIPTPEAALAAGVAMAAGLKK